MLRGAERVPGGRVLVVGQGFVGRLFAAVLQRSVATTSTPPMRAPSARAARPTARSTPPCCAPRRRRSTRSRRAAPCSSSPPPRPVDLDLVYRNELTLTGSRSATPRHMPTALELLPELDLPEPTVLPLDRFEDGLALYRSGGALKVVFTP